MSAIRTFNQMKNIHPFIKIVCICIVSIELFYMNYLMLDTEIMDQVIAESWLLKASALLYLFTIYLFAQLHWRRKAYLTLFVWLFFNLTIVVNGLFYVVSNVPPLFTQYAFSSSLGIYGFLLLLTKMKFPNWLRIFAATNLFILLPCVYFYFAKNWDVYKFLVYVLSFTPIIKSLVFLERQSEIEDDILDIGS